MTMKQTTLPSDVALQCPAWASDETKALAADARESFNTTKAARAESDRLRLAVGDVDVMTTSVADLSGAAGMARQAQLEALRDELVARSKFAEFLAALEVDRRRTETESLRQIETARSEAKQRLLDAGCRDLSAAVDHRGKPDETRRAAFDEVLNSFPDVGRWADQHREARSMGSALMERSSHNRRHQAETEAGLRKMLSELATAAAG